MGFHFTQELNIRKTGFGNTCMAELGVPTPIASELLNGSTLVDFDKHPYVARTGHGNKYDTEYDDQPVDECLGILLTHHNGMTRVQMVMDYSVPTFWGLPGQDELEGLELAEGTYVNSELTEVTFEVDYDSTMYVAYDLSRVAFQWIEVEKDGEVHRFENVACLPRGTWRNAYATYRMWGKSYSWGDGQKLLTIPWKEVRWV